ncbi:MAG TPA: hypothetical protein PLP83_08015 [Candidatus Aminicenantes bacterium]|nr:hypothetical protein [Candidatus Aminicenantes bacterium]
MLCAFSRWMIARAADTGKERPRSVERHLGRCGACRDHARFTASLKDRFAGEREAFLAEVPGFPLNESAWDVGPAPKAGPVPRGRRFVLRPLTAVAGALAVAAAALLLFRVVPREPAPRPEARAALESIFAAPDGLKGALAEAESSLERERGVLERSFASAADYLQARLNIRIERRPAPKPR